MQSNLFVTLSFISLFVLSGAVSIMPTNEYGPIPKTFCDPVDYEDLTLIGSDVTPVGATSGMAGGFPFTLTPNAPNKVGALWYKQPINLYNGFYTEFTLSFDSNEQTCQANGQSQRCGGEGIAFVIQQTGNDAIGGAGSGMGYSGLKNVLAVEFDTMYDAQTNDPSTATERHISIIIRKGTADANEVASIGRNNQPLNFKNDKSENYISSPVARIEYMNNNLRVFINDVLQLAYYYPLNLVNSVFQTTNPLFYMGFTASTGSQLAQKQDVQFWGIHKVQSDADHSQAVIVTAADKIIAGQNFDVRVTIKDRCNNFFYTNDVSKLKPSGFGDFNQTCKVVAVKSIIETSLPNTQANFLVTFNCTLNKENFVNFKWYNDGAKAFRDIAAQPTKVVIKAAPLSTANLIWTDFGYLIAANGQSPSTDANTPLRFTVVPMDAFGNEVGVDQTFINSITVAWPDKTTNRARVSAPVYNGNRLTFTVNVNVAGTYTISSPWFKRTFTFYVKPGVVSAASSIAYLGDASGNKFTKGTIKAGSTDVFLYLTLRDSAGNLIPVNTTDLDNQVDGYGVDWAGRTLNNSYIVLNDAWGNSSILQNNTLVVLNGVGVAQYRTTPYRAGTNTYQVWVRGVQVPFQPNSITVEAGDFCSTCPNAWQYVEVWPWNIQTNAYYRPATPSSIIVYKQGLFKALVITTDVYFNPIYKTTPYKLTLAGELMYPITMCSSSYNNMGSAHTLCASSGREVDNYNSLVQRSNYSLYVNDTAGNVVRTVQVYLVTFADDAGTGNGPWVPNNTVTWSWYIDGRTTVRCTNSFSDTLNSIAVGVQIRNAENKRTNRWFVKTQNIRLNTSLADKSREQFMVRTTSWTGEYIIYYITQTPEWLNGGRKIQVVIDKSEIYGATGLGLWPDDPVQYNILRGTATGTATTHFTTSTPVKLNIIPQVPLYAYMVDQNKNKITKNVINAWGNYTSGYNVDNTLTFNVAVFDMFGNPTWYEAPNWFRVTGTLSRVQFQNTFDAYVLAPQCNPTDVVGLYTCTMKAIKAGNYIISSPLFQQTSYTKLGFYNYEVYIAPGKPTLSASYAELDLTGQTYFLATQYVNFYITPRDQYLNLLPPDQTIYDNWFELLYQLPNNVSYTATNVKAIADASTGRRIQFRTQMNMSGITFFRPTLSGTALSCTYCSVTVKPNVPDWVGSKMQILVDGQWVTFDPQAPLQLDNYNKLPSFYLAIADIAGNLIGEIPKGWKDFVGTLTHPRFQSFPLNGLPYQNGVQFSLDQIYVQNYSLIVWDNQWKLTFSAWDANKGKTVSIAVNNVTTLGQGKDADSQYDSAAIDVSKSTINPVKVTVKAGTMGSFNVETRTSIGKLKKAFYTNGVAGNIELTNTWMMQTLDMSRASSYGTYTVRFNITQAGTYTLNVRITKDDGNKANMPQLVTIVVEPNDVYKTVFYNRTGLVLSDTHFYEKTVDDTITFVLNAYDFWQNPITTCQPKALGLSFHHGSNANAEFGFTVTKGLGAGFNVQLTPKTVGNYSYAHTDLTQPSGFLKLTLPVTVGNPSPTNSLAEVLNNKIKPTDNAWIHVFPTDQYQNPVPPSVVNERFPGKSFKAQIQYPGANGKIVDLGEGTYDTETNNAFYWKAANLTQAGDYTFTTYWVDRSQQTKYVSRIVTVEATEAVFFEMNLNVKDPKTQSWIKIPRVDDPAFAKTAPEPIRWDPVSKPSFQMDLRDRFDNKISIVPSNWTLSLRLINAENTMAEAIYFCYDGAITFHFCSKNNSKQPQFGTNPEALWMQLVTTDRYFIELNNGDSIYQANWTFVPNPSDESASDNPLDVQKTVISPQSVYTTTAGQSITFEVELRATDNLRKKLYLENPADNITLEFAQDNDDESAITYNVALGQLLGQYVITVTPTKAYAKTNPNQITVLYNGQRYVGFQPYLVSNPARPSDIFAVGFQNTENSQIGSGSVDSKFSFTIQAVDIYGNTVPLTSTDAASVKVVDPNGQTVSVSTYVLQSTFISAVFQPKVIGTYKINVDQRHNYTATFTHGVPSSDITTFTVQKVSHIAGEQNQLIATVFDQWGNVVPLNQDIVKNFTAFFNLQNSLERYTIFNPIFDGNHVVYSLIANTSGIYEFSFAYKNKEAICNSCSATVTPAEVSFANSSFQYFSPQSLSFVDFSPSKPVVEDNVNSLPLYAVQLRDRFGNALTETPSGYSISLNLSGNNALVNFNTTVRKDGIILFDLPVTPITVGGVQYADVSNYWSAILFDPDYYTLTFTDGTHTHTQTVIMKGNGDKDLDASNLDFSISNTIISTTSLTTLAHEYVSFIVETRTVDNKRKANLLNADIKVTFAQKTSTDNYTVLASDKTGVYVVSVITDKAYTAEENQYITFSVNGENYATPISLVVKPNTLYYAKIVEATNGALATVNATENIKFNVIGTDEYGNTINGIGADYVTLQVYLKNAPENRANPLFSFSQTQNSVLYSVDATYAGEYLIASPMFKDPMYYEYTITPAQAYAPNSVMSIAYGTDFPLRANVSVQITVSLYDKYNNLLLGSDVDFGSFNIALIGSTGVAYACNPTTKSYWNFVNCTVYPTVADDYVVNVDIYGEDVPQSGSTLTINPGSIDISKTTFFKDVSTGLSVAVPSYSVGYGTKGFQLEARFRDYWGNAIQEFDETDAFNIQLYGNDMNTMSLVETRVGGSSVIFSTSEADAPWFERLVNATDYTILAIYSRDGIVRGNATLPFTVDGISSDAGNSNYDLYFTKVDPFTIDGVAGFITTFTIELRTKHNKRYNGPIAQDAVVVSSVDGDDSALQINTTFTGTNGRWVCTINSTKSYSLGDQKFLQIKVEGKAVPNVQPQLVIVPDFPTIFTLVSQDLTGAAIPENIPQIITFRLFDKYGNQYTDSSVAAKIAPYSATGNVDFGTLTQSGGNFGDFNLAFVPYFPPLVTELDIHLAVPGSDPSQNAIKSVLGSPFRFNVTSSIDAPSTDIVGTSWLGIPVDEEMEFTVLVRNKKLYCYAGDANVSVVFHGPYSSYTINDKKLATSEYFNFSAEVEVHSFDDDTAGTVGSNPYTAKSCLKYYSIRVPAGSLQKAGIYQMEVSVNQWTPIIRRQTVMRAGQFDEQHTEAFIPTGYGNEPYGKTPVEMVAAETFSFQMQLFDKYDNIITADNGIVPASFGFGDAGLTENDYSFVVLNNRNGSYSVTVNVTKEGTWNQFRFYVNNLLVEPSNMYKTGKLNNFPNYIAVTPGYCSNVYPVTPEFTQFGGIILVGRPNSFYLACADKYNNLINVTKPEAQFTVTATGTELDTVGTDRIYPTVTPVANGRYEVTFTVAWSGSYSFRIQLRQAQYLTVTYNAQYSLCPSSTPYYCANVTATGQAGCTTGPLECTFPGITFSQDPAKPFVCNDGSLVKALEQCPCPSGQAKSPITGLCAQAELSSNYFPDVADITCPDDHVKCTDGTCRQNINDCPALRTCAPGYTLCPDLQCAATPNECTAQFSTCPPAGDTVRIFKCWDQSCAASVDACPTRVTCPVEGQVFCEGKCVDNALQCQQPAQCFGVKALRCPDGSCANKTSDCPVAKSCGTHQALCADGSCQETCSVVAPSIMRRMLDTTNSSIYTKYVCPSGEEVPSIYNCPSAHVCGANKIQCPDGSCVSELSQCAARSCPAGTVACWDGKCETSLSRCATRTTCPDELSTLCPDGSCKASSAECTSYVECPVFFPYRCGSGECRSRAEDCPTLVVCPPEMPIKCQDQSCVRSKIHCSEAAANVCEEGAFRCPDGSCAASKSLCPTMASCPKGQIRCWNNECQTSTDLCPAVVNDTLVCPTDTPIRCADSSCRAKATDCPTPVICPIEKPVLCDDGNCRESSENCHPDSGCTFGTKRCPDGSCIGETDTCGTPITCPASAPYRCLDMTCKMNPLDCPATTECPAETPIRCGDGTCVTSRIYCRALSACPANTPVRCPDMISCVSSREECPAIQSCPAGFVQCDDGSCSISQLTCPTKSCPVHLSHKCADGFCVSNPEFCSDATTGCPYDAKVKCADGSCKPTLEQCGPVPTCPEGQSLCNDGSCSKSCTGLNKVGCSNNEIKCTNGQCVDPTKTQCPVASCPTERPAKCLNGQCVSSLSNCPSTLPKDDFNFCAGNPLGNFVPCADGTCVASAEQCRPILPCANLFVRCDDGSCRPTKEQCPLSKTCPASRSYRCPSGVCAPGAEFCPSDADGCPARFPRRCQKTGQCISNKTEEVLATLNVSRSSLIDPVVCNGSCSFCDNVTDEQINQAKLGLADQSLLTCAIDEDVCNIVYQFTTLSNGCNFLKPFKCSNNTCVSSLSQCDVANSCPAGQFLCLDNTCAESADVCRNKSYDCSKNETHRFQCPDKKCAKDPRDCLTKEGCPVATPYRCADGRCVSAPTNKSGEAGCAATIQCPAYKPYVCSDGECVGDSKFCQIEIPCGAGKVRCNDRSCADSLDKCNAQACPPKRPILCSTGTCVEKAIECQQGTNICPSSKPFRCAVGVCVSSPAKCDMFTSTSTTAATTRRLLARLLDDSSNSTVNPGCPADAPYKCYDGSCRAQLANCPVFPACNDPKTPFRCGDGSCAASKKACAIPTASCQGGLQACADGICRQAGTCPAFDGCPLDKPLQCGNGYCASTLAECAGHSDCPSATPFRCANNMCVSDMSACPISVRSYSAEDISITISPITTTTFSFITEPGTAKTHASIIIPSGTLLPPFNSTLEAKFDNMIINIKPVAQSTLSHLSNPIDETRIDYTGLVFPLSDAQLSFYQTVRSSVFSIDALDRDDNTPYRFPIYLTIDYEPVTTDSTDYCLGQANFTTQSWTCLRSSSVSNSSTSFTFNLTTDGVYAVIFNPERREAALIAAIPTWWDQHKGQFFLWGGVTLLSVAIFSYVFWRMMRYVTKYRQSKKTMKNFDAKIRELQQQSTDILGQSLRDKVEGIVFVVNPMHEKHEKPDLSADIKEMEKALSKLEERDKQLEADNQALLNRNKILEKELSKLKEQFAQ